MRYGVVSDIHGNLLALDAVLRAFAQIGTQEILCAGDIVGYGAQPNECVERLAGMGAVAVAGNHDLFAVDRLQARAPRLVSASTEWTRRVLSRDSVAYLEGLPLQASVPGITLAHGSLDHPLEYVGREDTAGAQLSLLSAAQPQASVLILGHTHRAMAYAGGRMIAQPRRCGVLDLPPGPALLNPGSVGQSRQVECPPRARALVLDWPPGRALFLAIRYDTGAARRILRDYGLPTSGIHLVPGRLAGLVRECTAVLGQQTAVPSNRPRTQASHEG